MKLIKKYKTFINEVYLPTQSEAPEVASQMNTFNDKEKMIRDFMKDKVTISNIYMQYKDEVDLINKLSARKFIEKKTQNKKQIKFNNELLAIWAESCDKRRDLKNLEDSITKIEGDISTSKENMAGNPGLQQSEQESIDRNNEKIVEKKAKIEQLKKEIMDLERNTQERLEDIKKDLKQSKTKMDIYKAKKTAFPADTSEQK